MWSEARERPRDAHRIADELHSVLTAASEPPPYVMVGHSLGGLLIRVYDHRFPGDVAGFVFEDASHPEQWQHLPTEIRGDGDGDDAPWLWLEDVKSAVGFTRLSMRTPKNAAGAHAPRSRPGMLAEAEGLQTIADQAAQTGDLGARPIVVLTAGQRTEMRRASEAANREWADAWRRFQSELGQLSSNADWRVLPDAGHYLHLRDPDAVVAAVVDVVTAVRTESAVRDRSADPE
jgi:pimeloyl-ACP methyl ester carboxylesterase